MNKMLKEHYDELQTFINCIKVGIFITDGQGKVLMLNDESEKTGGMTKNELIGRYMEELIEIGYVTESSVVNVMGSNHEESIIQELGSGGQLYITGMPFFQDGEINMIVCTERDITESINLRELLKEKEEIAEKYENELEYFRKKGIDQGKHIIARSEEMKRVVEMAMRIAMLDTTTFLKGESGTGKEVIATLLHENSSRRDQPFIRVNCAAIPENLIESELFGYDKGAFTGADINGKAGIFELADNGTLFLDEISELPIQMQPKLLRVLQEREIVRIGGKDVIPVNVRIIVASNVDMLKALREGRFREDLYYRLNIIPIEMPPLRKRREDIAPLSAHFVKQFNMEYNLNKTLQGDAVTILEEQQWPGNVRELRNMIERVVISFDGNNITAAQISSQFNKNGAEHSGEKKEERIEDLSLMIEKYEKKLLEDLMMKYRNGSEVARLLNIDKSTVSRKLKKYQITI